MTNIEPRTLKGFRDFLPEKQIPRQKFIKIIQKTYELFGFEPLETPALEYAEILTGKYGDEGDKLMYRFKDNGDREVALRYDLTIPLARVVAQYGEIKKPWKRYQIGPVWRAENTQRGRFREFYQCDADIVGTKSPLADAEILALGTKTMRSLGIEDFVIRINDREILKDFYGSLGLDEKTQSNVLREVDKIEKIGRDEVVENLQKVGVEKMVAEKIVEFADSKVNSFEELDKALQRYPALSSSLPKLKNIIEIALGLDQSLPWVIDFSIARGLDYYTGMIFETNLTKIPEMGSVLSGGRYDGLIGIFGNKEVPAVGASVGLDRLQAGLEELGLTKEGESTVDVLLVNFEESLIPEYLKMTSELRDAGVNTVLYFESTDMKKQLAYASEKGIRFAVIYGANEAKEGTVVIKDLKSGEQKNVKREDLISTVELQIK